MNKRTLYLFTNDYPFGHIENFLETEIEYLCNRFENVVIIPISGAGKPLRSVPSNCKVLQPIRHGKWNALLKGFSIRRFPYFIKEFFNKKVWRKRSRIRSFLTNVINVNNYLHSSHFKKLLKQVDKNDVFYSYWGKVGTDLWPFMYGKAKLVSRFHGDWDLWGTCEDYAPFRNQIASVLDSAVFISEKGRKYFLDRWDVKNTCVYPLGTINEGFVSKRSSDGIFRIVSCSAIYHVKRVDLIYQALQLIEDREIEWTHIGGGRGGKETEDVIRLKEMVSHTRSNVTINLLGPMSNEHVLNYYKNKPVDLFVNVSIIEGVPVSIMEAISYDIPVVATNVGATDEVVTPQSGELISPNPSPDEVKNAILKALSSQYTPKEHWSNHFNAKKNYASWAQYLYDL